MLLLLEIQRGILVFSGGGGGGVGGGGGGGGGGGTKWEHWTEMG